MAYSELALLLDMNDRIFATVSELETLFSIKITKTNIKTNITAKDDSWQPLSSPGSKNRRPRGNTEPSLLSSSSSSDGALRIAIRQGSGLRADGSTAATGTPSGLSVSSSPGVNTPPRGQDGAWRHRAVHVRSDHPPLPSLVLLNTVYSDVNAVVIIL